MQQQGSQQPDLLQFLRNAPQSLSYNLEQNLQNRLNFPTETQKFYSTQQSIHNILTVLEGKLQETEQAPDQLITKIIESKILIPVLKTLEHPNLDINISAVSCFYSLIVEMNQDIEQAQNLEKQPEEDGDAAKAFASFFRMVVWMIENGLVESLFTIISRLDEQKIEQYEATRKILKMYQTLIQLSNQSWKAIIGNTTLISFLSNRILPNFRVSHRILDDNKFISSDVLLELLQTPELEQQQSGVHQFYKCYGIEILISTISSYENKLPTSLDETQYLINLFDCLNLMLVAMKDTRKQFFNFKGSYLMISYVCTKSQYAIPALKAVSNSLSFQDSNEEAANKAEQIVNDGSLKYLFPILMMQGVKGKDDEQQGEINEHIVKIMYYLLKNSQGVSKDRVVYKLSEKRFAKLERVFELLVQNGGEIDKKDKIGAQEYIKLVKQQNFGSAETCCKIVGTMWGISCSACSSSKIQQKILALMGMYLVSAHTLKTILELHYKYIDEGAEKQYIAKLLAGPILQIQHSHK